MRRWLSLGTVVVVGAALGLAISGVPRTSKDRPLLVREVTTNPPTTTTTTPVVPWTVPPTSTVAPSVQGTTVIPTTTTPAPATVKVKVQVVNVSAIDGAAARASDKLRSAGYITLPAASIGKTTIRDVTQLQVRPGFESIATQVAATLGVPGATVGGFSEPPTRCVPACDQMDVLVFLARDGAQRL